MNINALLGLALKNNASDLHLIAGVSPSLRINGELEPVTGQGVLTGEDIRELLLGVLDQRSKDIFIKNKEVDFSYSLEGKARFRINAYFSQGNPAAAFRVISSEIPSIEELNLPDVLHSFTNLKQGFILVTGPTGHGKSSTVASILKEINDSRNIHILTLEDPIEYILKPSKAIISQREIGIDSLSWKGALRSCLREDLDVVFVGEMRDLESIAMALTIAETGHLVFSTLHTNSAAQTVDRIIGAFSEDEREQIRLQLSNVLAAVISQRLVPTLDNSRVPAVEILISNQAVKTSIRENKTHMIDNIIQTSLETGMISLERSLASWVNKNKISPEIAELFSPKSEELNRQLRERSR